MKRQGSILILVLLVFVVVLLGAMYMLHSSTMHMYIARNNSIDNQGFYTSEAKINMCMYEEKYFDKQLYPIILNQLRKRNYVLNDYVLFSSEDLEVGDNINKVDIRFEMKDNRSCIKLVSGTKYDNIRSNASSFYTIINEIFEWGIPILDIDSSNDYQYEKVKEYISELEKSIVMPTLPDYMKGVYSLDYDSVEISTLDYNNLKLSYSRGDLVVKTEEFIDPYKNYNNIYNLLIIMRDKYNKGVSLHINSPDKPTKFFGTLYIEGDLIINSEFIFNGIIIMNNGKIIVNSEINPVINGIIISNGEEDWIDISRVNINYSAKHINYYGTFLPDFLKYEFLMMKRNKIGE